MTFGEWITRLLDPETQIPGVVVAAKMSPQHQTHGAIRTFIRMHDGSTQVWLLPPETWPYGQAQILFMPHEGLMALQVDGHAIMDAALYDGDLVLVDGTAHGCANISTAHGFGVWAEITGVQSTSITPYPFHVRYGQVGFGVRAEEILSHRPLTKRLPWKETPR